MAGTMIWTRHIHHTTVITGFCSTTRIGVSYKDMGAMGLRFTGMRKPRLSVSVLTASVHAASQCRRVCQQG